MRVMFTSLAAPGHYFPLVPLGWALRAAGHDVRVAVEPRYADAVTRSGLTAVVAGQDVDLGTVWRAVGVPREAMSAEARHDIGNRMLLAVAEAVLSDAIAFAQAWRPDLVIYEPVAYAGPVLARHLGVPAVRFLWGPDGAYLARTFAEPVLAELATNYGLGDLAHLGDLTIDPCPPSMQYPVDYPVRTVRYVPYNGPGAEPGWPPPGPGQRRVCVTWGTSFGRSSGHLQPLREAVRALAAGLGAEILVAVAADQLDLLGELPPDVRVAQSVPLHLLLASCDLIVHQGGAGTTLTSAALGVPQLVVPDATLADELTNAEQLSATGAGLLVELASASAESLRSAATEVLGTPGYREAAARLQQEIAAQPPPAAVVGVLEQLASATRPRRRDPAPAR